MVKKLILFFICLGVNALYGMSRSERVLLKVHPSLTKDECVRLDKYLAEKSKGHLTAVDYFHIFAPVASIKGTEGFHVANTPEAQSLLNKKSRVDHPSGAYWAALQGKPEAKGHVPQTFFPDEFTYKDVVSCFAQAFDTKRGKGTKPNGDKVFEGKCKGKDKLPFNVLLILTGTHIKAAYPMLESKIYKKAVNGKFKSRK